MFCRFIFDILPLIYLWLSGNCMQKSTIFKHNWILPIQSMLFYNLKYYSKWHFSQFLEILKLSPNVYVKVNIYVDHGSVKDFRHELIFWTFLPTLPPFFSFPLFILNNLRTKKMLVLIVSSQLESIDFSFLTLSLSSCASL